VYVRPFPTGTGRVTVSRDGGGQPRWSRDARTLVYRVAGVDYRAARLDVSGALPRVVRTDSLALGGPSDRMIWSYDVHPDGKHFVVTRDLTETKVVWVTNWLAEVRAALARR